MTYVQGFVIPVPEGNRDAYIELAKASWPAFKRLGALSTFEGWGDDIKRGETTDFYRAVKAEDGEAVVFSWVVWPDRETCENAAADMPNQPEFQNPPEEVPFAGKRMFWGGFTPIFEGD
ncbi:MAG: DUF1428 domain-containing protein [Pseudomonadota bacterium]